MFYPFIKEACVLCGKTPYDLIFVSLEYSQKLNHYALEDTRNGHDGRECSITCIVLLYLACHMGLHYLTFMEET